MYVKPNKAYTETSIDDLEVKEFAMPVIIDYNGDPINKALWNVCYNVNSKYKTSNYYPYTHYYYNLTL